MGMWDDIRRIRSSGKQVADASGRPNSMVDRVMHLPTDLAHSADAAEFAASQTAQAQAGAEAIADGLPGVAVLRGGFRATGELRGFQPVGAMDLEIALDGRQVYTETVEVVVPQDRLVLMTNGRRFKIEVDPNDRSRVAINWYAEPD